MSNVLASKPKYFSVSSAVRQSEMERNASSGAEAIKRILDPDSGIKHVPAAMHDSRLGEGKTGDIDIILGEPGDPERNWAGGYGLAHIVAKHGEKTIPKIADVVAHGDLDVRKSKTDGHITRAYYTQNNCIVVLRHYNDARTEFFVVTGYEDNIQKKTNPHSDGIQARVGQLVEKPSSLHGGSSKEILTQADNLSNTEKTQDYFEEIPDSTAESHSKNDGEIEIADPENKSLVRVKDIFTAMRKIEPVRKGIATRKKGVVGVAKRASHVARTRYWNDIPTALHETGHILDYKMGLREDIPMPMERNAINSELLELGKKTSGEKVVADYEMGDESSKAFREAEAYLTKEGIAEFFREYALDPAQAEQLAPSYYKRFTETLEKHGRFTSVVNELGKVTRDY